MHIEVKFVIKGSLFISEKTICSLTGFIIVSLFDIRFIISLLNQYIYIYSCEKKKMQLVTVTPSKQMLLKLISNALEFLKLKIFFDKKKI
jgi:hypothetical protein